MLRVVCFWCFGFGFRAGRFGLGCSGAVLNVDCRFCLVISWVFISLWMWGGLVYGCCFLGLL